MRFVIVCLLFAAPLLGSVASAAEDDADWQIRLAPYLWGVSIDGESQIGDFPPSDVDAGFGDILSNLNFAASLHTEFARDRWTFVFDPTYISLEIDDAVSGPPGEIDLDIAIWLVELWAGYRLVDHWEVIGGVRWQQQTIDADGNLNTPPLGPVDTELADEDWADVFLGVRAHYDLSENWLFIGRADIGVAGDSDTSLNGLVSFNRYFGQDKNRLLILGYRYFRNDFDTGSGEDFFAWDVDQTGPYIGYTWIWR